MKDHYDMIVVGAGPGGAITARTAARAGIDVLLIEKRQQIGDPVRCAEGVNKELLATYIAPDPAWICADVSGSRIFSPDGTVIEMGEELAGAEVGYVLERKLFDRALVREAANAGVNVMVKTRATGLLMNDSHVCGITAHHMGKDFEIRSKIVVGADGIESRVGRWAGINTTLRPVDMCTCAQYLMTGIDIDPNFCEFHMGTKIAPSGYLWVFPKGNDTANVGIGITGDKSKKGMAVTLLDKFVQRRFPGGTIIEFVVGGVPVSRNIERATANGLMLVGDAAHHSDPLTGGGIINSMWAGTLCGRIGAKAVQANNVSAEFLQQYEKEWRSELGRNLSMSYVVKERFMKLTDEDLNTLAHSLENTNLKNISLLGLLWALFKANKKLLWDLRFIFKDIKDIKDIETVEVNV